MILEKFNFKNINFLINKLEENEIEILNYESSNNFKNLKKFNIKLHNVFLIGEKESYDLFQIISNKSLELLKKNNININKNKYHIRAEKIEFKKGMYDFENNKNFCINGYVFFKNNTLKTQNENFNLNIGDIIFFLNSNKHFFLNDFYGLVFNVAPVSLLNSQFYGQWIPLLEFKND